MAAQGGDYAGNECCANAQRHGHVHADVRMPYLPPRVDENGPRRDQHHRRRQQQARPLHQARLAHGDVAAVQVHRPCVHHHLHHPEHRQPQADQQAAAFARLGSAAGGWLVRPRFISDVGNGCKYGGQPQRASIADDARAFRGVIDGGFTHARHPRKRALDQPHTGGATHAADGKRKLFRAIRARAYKALTHHRQIVGRPNRFSFGAAVAFDGLGKGDRAVIDVAHARGVQRLRDSLAAGTAKFPGLPADIRVECDGTVKRRCAVIAGDARRGCPARTNRRACSGNRCGWMGGGECRRHYEDDASQPPPAGP